MKKLLMFFSLVGLFVVGACGKTTTITTQTTTTTTSKQTTTTTEEEVKNPSLIYRKSIALKDDNVPLKVIQYADLHFGIEGTTYHNDKENRTKKYMKAMIEEKQPDLIVCSGDNILGTGIEGLKKFVAHMESLETPWVFMYGNHDHEGSSSKKVFNKYLTEADTKYLIYEEGFVDEKENRYGNFSLQILNQKETKLLGALFFLDAGTYDYGLADYQAITKAQIEWYKTEVDFYQYVYMGQKNNAHEIVPSIVFSHIQLPEFETAYTAAKSNSGNAEFIIPQDVNASSIGGSAPKVNTGFYDVLKEKQSTKAYFVGHMHTYYFQVKMDGIIMGFGPQTGFSKSFATNDSPRKTYMYHLNKDFTFTTEQVDENYVFTGLTYTSSAGKGEIEGDLEGKYDLTLTLAKNGYVEFKINGKQITTENTIITGDISIGEISSSKLYTSEDNYTFLCGNDKGDTYIIQYDEVSNTLDIKIKPKEKAEGSLSVGSKETDAGNTDVLNVFTEAGAKLRVVNDETSGDATWVGYGWRLILVMDSEGKICYGVVYPPNGFGGPNGNGYYCHPDYEDYTTNPAISLLDGYGPYVDGGFAHNLFEIVVPEGGFAISCHTTTLLSLVNIIKGTELTETAGIDTLLNNRTSINNDIRITYDSTVGDLGTIFVTTIE